MDEIREAVIEDVLQRLVEERGVEILALKWTIFESLLNKNNKDELNRNSYNDE